MNIEYILWFMIIVYTVVSVIVGLNTFFLIIFLSIIISIRIIIWLVKNEFLEKDRENSE